MSAVFGDCMATGNFSINIFYILDGSKKQNICYALNKS